LNIIPVMSRPRFLGQWGGDHTASKYAKATEIIIA